MEIKTFQPVAEYKGIKIIVRQYDRTTFEFLFCYKNQLHSYPYQIAQNKVKELIKQEFTEDELKKIKTMIEQEAVKTIDILEVNRRVGDVAQNQAHRNFINSKLNKK